MPLSLESEARVSPENLGHQRDDIEDAQVRARIEEDKAIEADGLGEVFGGKAQRGAQVELRRTFGRGEGKSSYLC